MITQNADILQSVTCKTKIAAKTRINYATKTKSKVKITE